MSTRLLSLSLLCAALALLGTAGAAPPPERVLAAYVAAPDASYRWQVRRQGTSLGVDYALLDLVSQRWRGTEWRHHLWILDPTGGAGARQALMIVAGGSRPAEAEAPVEMPDEAPLFATMARRLDAPVAVLRQVPFQPLFAGRSEDALIALTLERFLDAPGDTDWPLLLPMVKSVVRAMDTVQAFGGDWQRPVDAFTVTGASKRGWTTWLTASVDRRVRAIAPLVFDILNMEPQLQHQREAWGELSAQLGDYTARDLDDRLATEAGRRLQAIIDPYHYRASLTQPKLIVLRTNDDYWPIDALNLYWSALPEPRRVLYLPNQGHSPHDYGRLIPTLVAFHRHVALGLPLPRLDWAYAREGETVTLRVTASPAPSRARAWVAEAPRRDFRQARWRSTPMIADEEGFTFRLEPPTTGYAALFGEVEFALDGGDRMTLSTAVRVLTAPAAGY